ncbi:MAG: PqqD family protein [Pseudorhodoplanes sp.]
MILHLESGTYFGLDRVGTRVWQLLEDGKSLSEICDVMLEEFDVGRDALEHDTLALVEALADKHLLTKSV